MSRLSALLVLVFLHTALVPDANAQPPAPAASYLDAIDQDNYAVLDQWAKTAAGVSTPAGWFKDHFNHQPIWTFLSKLDVPIGFFQGSLDNATSIDGVKKLEEQAKQAGKTNMRFHYFEGLDHTLNIVAYFARSTLPEGHKAIFEFIESQVRK